MKVQQWALCMSMLKGQSHTCHDLTFGVNYNIFYNKNESRVIVRPWILVEFCLLEVARTLRV